MIAFRNICFFSDRQDGVNMLNFELKNGDKLFIETVNEEQTKYLSWLLTEKVSSERGIFEKPANYYCQSDRWWLEKERIVDSQAEKWLNLKSPFVYLEQRRQAKRVFIDKLTASGILHEKVYRLKGEDLLKFCLLSFLFQSAGAVVITQFWKHNLSKQLSEVYRYFVRYTPLSVIFISNNSENEYVLDLPVKKISLKT